MLSSHPKTEMWQNKEEEKLDEKEEEKEEEEEIVIVGGGISGLATALALHRKGIRSMVLERSDSLRISGVNFTMYTNGWRALEQLGLASKLRPTALRIDSWREISLDDHSDKITPTGKEEVRCLRRRLVVETMAAELPPGTIRFGYHVVGIESDPNSAYTTLRLRDGRTIKAKIIIGCDGVNSVVSKYLGLKPPPFESFGSIRGFTTYENGHGFDTQFVEMWKGKVLVARAPIDDKLVWWCIGRLWGAQDTNISKDATLIQQSSLEAVKGYPSEIVQMIHQCDMDTLSLTRPRYRPLKEVLFSSFRKGNVTLAGDAMHVIPPYFGQGGAAALEDAIVLARCMARAMHLVGPEGEKSIEPRLAWERVTIGFDQYVKERRLRLVCLGLRAFLISRLAEPSTPFLVRVLCIVLMIVLFRDLYGHAKYDCGHL